MRNILCLSLLLNVAYAQPKKEITLENIFKKPIFSIQQESVLQSLNDGKSYVTIRTNQKTGEKQVLKSFYGNDNKAAVLFGERNLKFKGLQLAVSTNFSADESKVLLHADEEPIYRHSFKANYFVYHLKTKKIIY